MQNQPDEQSADRGSTANKPSTSGGSSTLPEVHPSIVPANSGQYYGQYNPGLTSYIQMQPTYGYGNINNPGIAYNTQMQPTYGYWNTYNSGMGNNTPMQQPTYGYGNTYNPGMSYHAQMQPPQEGWNTNKARASHNVRVIGIISLAAIQLIASIIAAIFMFAPLIKVLHTKPSRTSAAFCFGACGFAMLGFFIASVVFIIGICRRKTKMCKVSYGVGVALLIIALSNLIALIILMQLSSKFGISSMVVLGVMILIWMIEGCLVWAIKNQNDIASQPNNSPNQNESDQVQSISPKQNDASPNTSQEPFP